MIRKLSDWASVAEIVGAAAIVVSLVFVGLEIRNGTDATALNTRALQMNAYQTLVGQINDVARETMEHPEVTLLRPELPENLSPEQWQQVNNDFIILIRHGDLAFYQFQLGMLTEERLHSVIGPLRYTWCMPMFRRAWAGFRENADSGYREFLDSRIAENCGSED